MVLFLTSSPSLGWGGDLNPANGFIEELGKAILRPLKCLMITSAPDDREMTDRMAWELREIFEHANLPFMHYEVLDRRTQRQASRMIAEANFIILCGGHVPTQNKFFRQLNLAAKLKRFNGVVMSISAGSMNCADVVYASPELDTEATDVKFNRFISGGLGLTTINIIPHYHTIRDYVIDGIRLEDILNIDSYARPIYCMPDGSWIKIDGKGATLYGEAWLLRYGKKTELCKDNMTKKLY